MPWDRIFFSLLLLFLPTQLGLHVWPEWSMVLGRRVDFLSPTIYLTDIFIGLIISSWFFAIHNKFLISNFKLVIKQKKVPVSIYKTILFLGFVSANIYFAQNRMIAIYMWLKVLEYSFLAYYIIYTKPKFSDMIFPLSFGVLYSSVIAIVQFLLQHSVGGPLWWLGERSFSSITPGIAQFNFCHPLNHVCSLVMRAYGTFPHPNVLGGFLAILLPLLIFNQTKKFSIIKPLIIILGIIALFLTFSRSAWIAALIGVGLMNYELWKKSKLFMPTILVSMIIILFIASSVGLRDESVIVRTQLNNSAIKMFLESPVLGKGLGNFLVTLPDTIPSRQIYFLQPVHNIYLLVLSETGVIGFTLFIGLLWTARKKRILILVLFLGFFDHYFLTLQQGQLLLTILLSSTIVL